MSENESVVQETAISAEEQGITATEGAETAETEDTTQNETSETAISEDVSSENTGNAEPEFALEVQYNKASQTLTREQAKDYAEQGMFYSNKIRPVFDKLDYVAAQRGQTIEEVVDGILAADESHHREELVDRFGEDSDVIDDLMRLYREGQKQKYDKIVSDRKAAAEKAETEQRASLEKRLADEFLELKTEFPELTEFSALPKEVKAEAAKGRDLLSAFLRYRHGEEKKISAAKSAAETANKATTGSGDSAEQQSDGTISALLSGIWK